MLLIGIQQALAMVTAGAGRDLHSMNIGLRPESTENGFSSLQMAFFTMTARIGMITAQVYGFFLNDKTPLWVARRSGGTWHTEYRLANTVFPSIILPIGWVYGACLQYHLHYMVLALGSFLIWFAALLALPVLQLCRRMLPAQSRKGICFAKCVSSLLRLDVRIRCNAVAVRGWCWVDVGDGGLLHPLCRYYHGTDHLEGITAAQMDRTIAHFSCYDGGWSQDQRREGRGVGYVF